MSSSSKSQQRLFGQVRDCQKNGKCSSKKVKDLADKMSKKDVKDFASTKHKGLPEKKLKSFKEYYLEESISPESFVIHLGGAFYPYCHEEIINYLDHNSPLSRRDLRKIIRRKALRVSGMSEIFLVIGVNYAAAAELIADLLEPVSGINIYERCIDVTDSIVKLTRRYLPRIKVMGTLFNNSQIAKTSPMFKSMFDLKYLEDDSMWMVMSDWLEENGDLHYGELARSVLPKKQRRN